MDVVIKKLSPKLIDDYLNFFDLTPHSTEKDEHKCYCVCWASTSGDPNECSTAEKRRKIAERYIRENYLQGYLAYFNDKVVGWCNANTKSDCYECISWRMFMKEIEKDDKRIKSVYCFAINPQFRGLGIATKLLEVICDDAKTEGFDYVEAYPNIEYIDTEQDFMGPYKLFEKFDFVACYNTKDKIVLRKKLK